MSWTYNPVDPNVATNAPTVAGVDIFFTILSLLVVSLRIYVRKCIVKAINIDDWLTVGTWGLRLQKVEDMPFQNVYEFRLLQYAGAPFYICAILGFKIGIIFAFLRIAVDRTYRISIICVAVICSAFYFCFFVAQLNFCTPVSTDSLLDDTC
ncbi:hypothetical protein BDZ45DRAFT_751421 [Acephala macrosclerotiorum]|nr:hypothetical protein BDZ45DRAFT_751421 [Acephala macrosclerotiorum]